MIKLIIKTVLVISFILVSFFVKAQDFQGKAEYQTKIILNKDSSEIEIKSNEDEEFRKAFDEAMKKATENKYNLIFNKYECIYEKIEELQKPENTNGMPTFQISFSGEGKKYINLKENKFINEDEIFGKEFLIVEELKKPNWKLLEGSKKIGEYTCMKAELIIPVTPEQQKEYDEFLEKEKTKPSLFKIPKPEDKVVTAWYTPEVPVSIGPDNYWGLPGLILEISEKNKVILCTKLTLSNKSKTEIKKPSTGKVVTQSEFDDIQKKKMDSMKDEDGNVIFQTQD